MNKKKEEAMSDTPEYYQMDKFDNHAMSLNAVLLNMLAYRRCMSPFQLNKMAVVY